MTIPPEDLWEGIPGYEVEDDLDPEDEWDSTDWNDWYGDEVPF